MNRDEFLEKLFRMYPATFTPQNMGIWAEGYEAVLKNNWDYNKLFNKFVRSYDKTNIAPAPSYFIDFKKDVEIKKEIEQIEPLEDICPPTKEFLELKAKLSSKVIENNIKMKG